MAQLSDENEKVTSSVIPNQTEAKIMRNLIENKGLLNGKGKLYAGTDDTTSTGAPVTTAIDPSGAVDDSVLIKDSSQAGGWTVDKIGKDNIKDAAITPEKLDPNQYYGFKDAVTVAPNLQSLDGPMALYKYNGIEYSSSDDISNPYNGTLEFPHRKMGFSSETIATEEEVKRQIENGEIVAMIAQYASEDTSKGTIEERLERLGFKEGTLTVPTDEKDQVVLNYIRKQGNIVTIWFAMRGDYDATSNTNSNYPGGTITCELPSQFVPQSGSVGDSYTFFDSTSRSLPSSGGSAIYKNYKVQIKITSENIAQIIFNSISTDIPYWSITYDITQCQPDEQIGVRLPSVFSCPTGKSESIMEIDLTSKLEEYSKIFIIAVDNSDFKWTFSGGTVVNSSYTNYGVPLEGYGIFTTIGDKSFLGTKMATLSCQLKKENTKTTLLLRITKQKLVEDSSSPIGYVYQPDTTTSASIDNRSSTANPFTIVFLPY